MCLESLWVHNVGVFSAVLEDGAVKTSIDSNVYKLLSIASREDQDRVLVAREGRMYSCVVRNLETIGEADALSCVGKMIDVPVYSVVS